MKFRKRFKVMVCGEPEFKFIPAETISRLKLYEEFLNDGIVLPPYKDLNKLGLNKVDLIVLTEDFRIYFEYKGYHYELIILKGTIWDGSSTPVNIGNLSRVSPYSIIASLIHDTIYGNKYFSFSEANEIYSQLLRYRKAPVGVILLSEFGLLFAKRRYREIDPNKSWLKGFSKLKQFHPEKPELIKDFNAAA